MMRKLLAATGERPTDVETASRQRDYDFFSSEQFRQILARENIKLITWRELVRLSQKK